MYHLLVSGSEDAWNGTRWELPANRCIRRDEYTDESLTLRFGDLESKQITELLKYPCVFAYETGCKLDAKLGQIKSVQKRGSNVRLEFELSPDYPLIRHDDLIRHRMEFDIGPFELARTHWAVKNEDLRAVLLRIGYPPLVSPEEKVIDVFSHEFEVALSFPGEVRSLVEAVAHELVSTLGKDHVFYDNFYQAQLARPNLDSALQELYRNHSRLLVVFLSKDYAAKMWCGIEWRAIRAILNEREDQRIMLIRHGDVHVEGIFKQDGYIDVNRYDPVQIAQFIRERVMLLRR